MRVLQADGSKRRAIISDIHKDGSVDVCYDETGRQEDGLSRLASEEGKVTADRLHSLLSFEYAA